MFMVSKGRALYGLQTTIVRTKLNRGISYFHTDLTEGTSSIQVPLFQLMSLPLRTLT